MPGWLAIVARPLVSTFRPVGVVFKPLREPRPMLDLDVSSRTTSRKACRFGEGSSRHQAALIGGAGASLAPSPGDPAET